MLLWINTLISVKLLQVWSNYSLEITVEILTRWGRVYLTGWAKVVHTKHCTAACTTVWENSLQIQWNLYRIIKGAKGKKYLLLTTRLKQNRVESLQVINKPTYELPKVGCCWQTTHWSSFQCFLYTSATINQCFSSTCYLPRTLNFAKKDGDFRFRRGRRTAIK